MNTTLFLFVLFLPIYLVPMIVAGGRRHRNLLAVSMLNIFLGWTFLGWVVALVWACMATQSWQPPKR